MNEPIHTREDELKHALEQIAIDATYARKHIAAATNLETSDYVDRVRLRCAIDALDRILNAAKPQ